MVETKVTVATIAAGLASIGWAIIHHEHVDTATVQTIVMALVTFIGGYLAPHTPRTPAP